MKRVRRLASWAVWWTLLFGLWLLLVGTVERLELIAGAAAAALGAAAAEAVRAQGLLRFRLERRWLARGWRPFARTVPDFALVTAALLRSLVRRRPVRGKFRALPFPAGGTDAASAGRRAFATVAGSLAPNTLVVDVDPDEKLILVHELEPRRSPGGPL
jgi:multisubunit Na+/H+ antiporter MnhE subunit